MKIKQCVGARMCESHNRHFESPSNPRPPRLQRVPKSRILNLQRTRVTPHAVNPARDERKSLRSRRRLLGDKSKRLEQAPDERFEIVGVEVGLEKWEHLG